MTMPLVTGVRLHVRRDFLRNSITVDFKSIYGTATIKLYSKFTCISGENSGEGKTEFLTTVRDLLVQGLCTITASNGWDITIVIEAGVLKDVIQKEEPGIIIVDELMSEHYNLVKRLSKSNKLVICVNRSYPLKGEYPLIGTYALVREGDWFTFKDNTKLLPLLSDSFAPDIILTEASANHSENELLSIYFQNIKASGSRDKIEKHLRNTSENILVLADLGNIGRALHILCKRCKENPNIRFYDYQAFEELLFKSDLVQGDDNRYPKSCLDFLSLETYYEKALEDFTRGTPLEYHHGEPLAVVYLDKSNCKKIFDTDIGRPLYKLIQNTETFDCFSYLKSQLGESLTLVSPIAVENCETKEDCDELIQSVSSVIQT